MKRPSTWFAIIGIVTFFITLNWWILLTIPATYQLRKGEPQ